MLQLTELQQNTAISHGFQQKLTKELRQKNNHLSEISCGGKFSIYFVKLTLPILYTQNS